MINFIVVTHGEFGAYLIEAAEEIVGRQTDGVRSISISARFGMDEVRRRIARAVSEMDGGDGILVVTDMPGGTPSNAVLPLVKDRPGVAVLSGLNLYMLVSGFSRRRELPLGELSRRMLADGQRSIQDVKALLNNAHTARAH